MAQNKKANRAGKQSNGMNKVTLIIGVAATVILVLFGLYNLFSMLVSDNSGGETLSLEHQPMLGDEQAPVTIVEYADFKCPACANFHQQILPRLKEDFIESGQAKLYFVNFPVVSEDSYTAALAGEAVYQQDEEAFWKFYDQIFANQPDERERWATPEFFVSFAEEHLPQIDREQLKQELSKGTLMEEVIADQQAGRQDGIHSTPSLVINGEQVENPFDYDAIRVMIETVIDNTSK